MVNSQVVSITAANHADEHRHGGDDPLTGDVRVDMLSADNHDHVAFAGAAPTVWTDLDLSAIVGANHAIVALAITNTATTYTYAVRRNGDTDTYNIGGTANDHCQSGFNTIAGEKIVLIVETDNAGIIEWKVAGNGLTTTVDVLWSIS